MTTLITPYDVIVHAYSDSEMQSPSAILHSDIAEAEGRYIAPVLGERLIEQLYGGGYSSLLEEYVAPALVAWTRYVVEHVAHRRCISCHDSSTTSADNERHHTTLRALRAKARTLLRRLSNHLNAHGDDYAEYNPYDNPLNRCFIDGDIIQIL